MNAVSFVLVAVTQGVTALLVEGGDTLRHIEADTALVVGGDTAHGARRHHLDAAPIQHWCARRDTHHNNSKAHR